ncbi:BgTH12-01724 [Blumeria graminis f. sp. triticale]|uniref:BgTH12-01724 n=1 Tax=Blumeria graminis f. sp. triticale TaxID=1689686 RepID=A0A9W4GDE8_BLUGR|nr:BgTH12-01724 [Blumeria graminis f. sp. triticale]
MDSLTDAQRRANCFGLGPSVRFSEDAREVIYGQQAVIDITKTSQKKHPKMKSQRIILKSHVPQSSAARVTESQIMICQNSHVLSDNQKSRLSFRRRIHSVSPLLRQAIFSRPKIRVQIREKEDLLKIREDSKIETMICTRTYTERKIDKACKPYGTGVSQIWSRCHKPFRKGSVSLRLKKSMIQKISCGQGTCFNAGETDHMKPSPKRNPHVCIANSSATLREPLYRDRTIGEMQGSRRRNTDASTGCIANSRFCDENHQINPILGSGTPPRDFISGPKICHRRANFVQGPGLLSTGSNSSRMYNINSYPNSTVASENLHSHHPVRDCKLGTRNITTCTHDPSNLAESYRGLEHENTIAFLIQLAQNVGESEHGRIAAVQENHSGAEQALILKIVSHGVSWARASENCT